MTNRFVLLSFFCFSLCLDVKAKFYDTDFPESPLLPDAYRLYKKASIGNRQLLPSGMVSFDYQNRNRFPDKNRKCTIVRPVNDPNRPNMEPYKGSGALLTGVHQSDIFFPYNEG